MITAKFLYKREALIVTEQISDYLGFGVGKGLTTSGHEGIWGIVEIVGNWTVVMVAQSYKFAKSNELYTYSGWTVCI